MCNSDIATDINTHPSKETTHDKLQNLHNPMNGEHNELFKSPQLTNQQLHINLV